MGKLTIIRVFSIAMLNYQRVDFFNWGIIIPMEDFLKSKYNHEARTWIAGIPIFLIHALFSISYPMKRSYLKSSNLI